MSNGKEKSLLGDLWRMPDQKEAKERERGENVRMDIFLSRHGKKASFNASDILDAKEIERWGSQMDLSNYDFVALLSTPVERAVRTAMAWKRGMEKTRKDEAPIYITEATSGILSKEGTDIEKILKETEGSKDVALISPKLRELYKKAVESTPGSSWDKEDAGVRACLEVMDKEMEGVEEILSSSKTVDESLNRLAEWRERKTKEWGGMSVLELAVKLISYLRLRVKVTRKMPSDSKTFIKEINHAGFIEPMLYLLLKEEIEKDPADPTGQDFLTKMGGAFEPNEAVKINIQRISADQPAKITFTFDEARGRKIYEIDENKIDKLVARYGLIK